MVVKNLNSLVTKIIALGIILVFTSSCFGVSVIGEEVAEIVLKDGCKYPLPTRNQSRIDLKIMSKRGDCDDNDRILRTTPSVAVSNSKEVLDFWGKPNRIKKIDELEYWTYRREPAWSGIWISVGIPLVPLMLPVGTRNDVIVFRGNKIEKILIEDGTVRYFFGWALRFVGTGQHDVLDFYFGKMPR